MKKPMLSLEPLEEARWETHPDTGARFKIAALTSEKDQELTRKATGDDGKFNLLTFYGLAVDECAKDWEHISLKQTPVPCNAENRAIFMKHHGLTIAPWIIGKARSLEHYLTVEVEDAKKG